MLRRWMMAFGVVVGLIFPPFAALILGTRRALAPDFFLMCVAAGLLVGIINFLLFRMVVSRQLARLAVGMRTVNANVSQAVRAGTIEGDWQLEITSDDAVGEIERSFNDMADAVERRLTLEQRSGRLHTRLSNSVELSKVATQLLQALLDVSDARAGLLYGNLNGEFRMLHNLGIDRGDDLPEVLDGSLGAIAHALDTERVITLSPLEAGSPPWLRQSSPFGSLAIEGVAVLPLLFERQPVGLAVLALTQPSLDERQNEHLELLRTQFAPYLQNAILHDRLRNLAALDDLTGILNRRFGLRRLEEVAGQAFRHGTPFSVLLLDIDHFKDLNDTYGHDAGDAVLKRVGSALDASVRSGDIACRYGGEEFMVVLAGTGVEDALRASERLRRQIETQEITWREHRLTVTASIGVVTWPVLRAATPAELVTAADRALYSAKGAGRNRVHTDVGEGVVGAQEVVGELGSPPR
jgi:diguanylate cyclase (GGDEF)-like protein